MKKKLITITSFVLLFFVATGCFVYLTLDGRVESNPASNAIIAVIRPYPKLTGPKAITLNCDYHGKKLSITETVYSSLYNYYKADPQKLYAYYNNKNEKFVYAYKNDPTIADMAMKIKTVGKTNNLSEDQTLDLAACFLQSMPYDTAKATKVLDTSTRYPVNQLVPRLPYETLYDGIGICTDKSYLGSLLFKQLGYKTSLLEFDSQRHMSVGVGVPDGYGDFGTKYAILELTGTNFLVGDVPDLNPSEGLAINNFDSVAIATENQPATEAVKVALTSPSLVVPISSAGNEYQRIITRITLRKQLEGYAPKLDSLKTKYLESKEKLVGAETDLNSAENDYTKNPTAQSFATYSQMYNIYTTAYNTAKTDIDIYNSTVKEYNTLVLEYRQF
ncbi:MAG: hypothetical protein WCP14_04305 [bacterium]